MDFPLLFLQTLLVIATKAQEFAYPELPGQRLDSKGKNGRLPLYAPKMCPQDQLLYPGDQQSDWICDCRPGFIYYPPKDKCYAAYKRGPCKENHYLVLVADEIIPECAKNQCEDGYVKYEDQCYELDKAGEPCGPLSEGGGIFGVNATTLELECLEGTDTVSLLYSKLPCPRGSLRNRSHKCRSGR